MNIYVASSWRNPWQPGVVAFLWGLGHTVYDFRNPPNRSGFGWSQIDAGWRDWTPEQYRRNLQHPLAVDGFASDMDALKACDACLLVLPCGNSAHLEMGWACGAGKKTAVFFPYGVPMTEIGGHRFVGRCDACGTHDGLSGCRLPAKLDSIEPELMVKMDSDGILIGIAELREWAG